MEEEVSKQYLKGFNNGYLLAQHEPELAAMLTKPGNDKNEYFQGLTHGQQEYDKEKSHSPTKEVSHDVKPKEDKERDK